ncbi:hypothetical protein RVR_4437 [Actinacidiphila reveromycinica]|uniref:Uncharacterized protein n=1 Tax=Actinacidiphila reveromycinica TaxID=659352 RepID=A0A7U3VP45_9ACTN|nr:hypothetical protein [Streptomyces sp. SN-593]BBA98304.1 hypothetical protein RVR_4437 [Streptomyces sp. SN-593]
MPNETAAELLAQAKKDYGTPAERQERQADARVQSGLARAHGAEAAQAPRGRR